MEGRYLGRVDEADPLYPVLVSMVSRNGRRPVFHVEATRSQRVYRYTEEGSGISVIGKFRPPGRGGAGDGGRELDNVRRVRSLGLDSPPCFVPRPLGYRSDLGLSIVSEYIEGEDLDSYLKRAAYDPHRPDLREALGRLAGLLHKLHSRSRGGGGVLDAISGYGFKIVNRLREQSVLNDEEAEAANALFGRWMDCGGLWRGSTSLVHGDATPTNFLFTGDRSVVALDLEMMKRTDPVFDVGMVCGELKHAFLWRTGSREASEPVIADFLRSYCKHGSEDGSGEAFGAITRRLPFFMALTELRIARNDYLSFEYRQALAREGMECLRSGLSRL